jgi:hypothetical protein
VWIDGDSGCVSEPTFFERVFGRCKGQRRLANRVKVLKDCKVWTQQGMSGRTGTQRPIDKAPRVSEDESERFDHQHSTAGTAWNVYGHPNTIGSGTREPPKYEPPKKKAPAKKKEAAPAKKADAAPAEKADGADKKAEAAAKKTEEADKKAPASDKKAEAAETKETAPAKKADAAPAKKAEGADKTATGETTAETDAKAAKDD